MPRLKTLNLSLQRSRVIRSACMGPPTAILLSLMLASCASLSPGREPVTRNIPGPPSYLQPVDVPPATVGISPFVVSEQRKQAIVRANGIITGARTAWTKMKATYKKSFLKR